MRRDALRSAAAMHVDLALCLPARIQEKLRFKKAGVRRYQKKAIQNKVCLSGDIISYSRISRCDAGIRRIASMCTQTQDPGLAAAFGRMPAHHRFDVPRSCKICAYLGWRSM